MGFLLAVATVSCSRSLPSTDTVAPDLGQPDQGEAEPTSGAADEVLDWPYADFWSVPQLGEDPARGSGCGIATPVGDVLPDGTWFGQIESIGETSLTFDGRCVYFGALGQKKHDDYVAAHPDEPDGGPGGDFWVVNLSSTVRRLPVSSTLHRRNATLDGCRDPGPSGDLHLADGPSLENDQYRVVGSWIIVRGGAVVFILSGCALG